MAIAALVAAIVIAYTRSRTFRDVVLACWGAIKAASVATFDAVRGAVLACWGAITAGASAVRSFVVGVWNSIKNAAP